MKDIYIIDETVNIANSLLNAAKELQANPSEELLLKLENEYHDKILTLKQSLNNTTLTSELKTKVSELLTINTKILNIVNEHKDKIQQNMALISKGKEATKQYNSN